MAEGEGRHVTVENERESVMRNPNVLSVMHGELQQAYERANASKTDQDHGMLTHTALSCTFPVWKFRIGCHVRFALR